MMTRNERLIVVLALAVAVVNFLFMGMGLLYYVCVLSILVVGIIGLMRWFNQRRPVTGH